MKILAALALLFINGAWALQLPAKDSEANGRMFYSVKADVGQFPYEVFLKMNRRSCGGVLIGREWVVTAAHCVFGKKSVTVYLGMTYTNNARVTYRINSDSIAIYEGYDTLTSVNDIALIKIPTTEISNTISPASLPPIEDQYSSYAHSFAYLSGWVIVRNKGNDMEQLQYTAVSIISNKACRVTYGGIAENDICVSGGVGLLTCQGGNPLVTYNNTLVGISSAGSAMFCQDGKTNIFTRITSYLKWIKSVTGISY